MIFLSSCVDSATPAVITEIEPSGGYSVWIKNWFCVSNKTLQSLLLFKDTVRSLAGSSSSETARNENDRWKQSPTCGRSHNGVKCHQFRLCCTECLSHSFSRIVWRWNLIFWWAVARASNEWATFKNSNFPHSFHFSFEYSNIFEWGQAWESLGPYTTFSSVKTCNLRSQGLPG